MATAYTQHPLWQHMAITMYQRWLHMAMISVKRSFFQNPSYLIVLIPDMWHIIPDISSKRTCISFINTYLHLSIIFFFFLPSRIFEFRLKPNKQLLIYQLECVSRNQPIIRSRWKRNDLHFREKYKTILWTKKNKMRDFQLNDMKTYKL